MRLGDLDALKEDMKSRLSYCNEWIEKAKDKETKIRASAVKSFIAEVIMTIDNAPTVEANSIIDGLNNEIDDLSENLAWYINERNRLLKDRRPQGEWIEVKPLKSDLEDGIDYREECSICHEPNRHYDFDEYHEIKSATYYKTKFCPNCGADMRGDNNEID